MDKVSDKIISKGVNFLFSKEKKIERWLLVLIIIGFILRLIAALNLNVTADDMLYASQSPEIWNSKILSTHSNPPLFFYLTDLSHKVFGYTTFASRFWPLIFGTLLIPLVFLITRKLFNKKVALAAAFFATFSNLLVKLTYTEHSLVVLFFAMFAVYFGLEYLDKRKFSYLFFSSILFGLAFLTKYSAPFFILSFLVFSVHSLKAKKVKIFTKRNIKHLILFFVIILFFCLPFLSFNYFIYKEKGILDVYFSRVFKNQASQQLYGGLLGQDTTFFQNLLNIKNYYNTTLLFHTDILILLFSLLGLFLMFKSKYNKQIAFFLIFLIIPFILQSAGSGLPKHFVFMPFLFSIPAGLCLTRIFRKINKKPVKIILISILVLIMIINLGATYGTPKNYFSKSEVSQLKSFINENVQESDLIVFDSRIYTAQAFWLGTPNHLLNLHQFINFYNYHQNLTENQKVPTRLYIVECAVDDCGWGWVKDNQELNQSSEDILSSLKESAQLVKTTSIIDYENEKNEFFSKKGEIRSFEVYTFDISLNSELVRQTDYMGSFYFAPYLYKNMENYVYSYERYSLFDNLLNKLGLFIIKISVLLSCLIALFFIFYALT